MFLFFLITLIIFLIFVTITFKLEINNLEFNSKKNNHLNKKYKIIIKFCIFYKIPIMKIEITNTKIKKLLKNKKILEKINKEKAKIIENKNDIDVKAIKEIRNIKFKVQKINLDILIGVEDASLTAIMVPIISTIISIFFRSKVRKINKDNLFLVKPLYNNENIINIKLTSIITIKLIHIINTMFIINKYKKGDKNERTSNRRSYDYGYE